MNHLVSKQSDPKVTQEGKGERRKEKGERREEGGRKKKEEGEQEARLPYLALPEAKPKQTKANQCQTKRIPLGKQQHFCSTPTSPNQAKPSPNQAQTNPNQVQTKSKPKPNQAQTKTQTKTQAQTQTKIKTKDQSQVPDPDPDPDHDDVVGGGGVLVEAAMQIS